MSDERHLREQYPDFLGEGATAERVRLVREIKAISAAIEPPPGLAASVRRVLQESAAEQPRETGTYQEGMSSLAQQGQDSVRPSPISRRRLAWPQPVRQGVAVAGLAGFVLVVAVIAIGLAAVLPRMEPRQSSAPSTPVRVAPVIAGTALPGASVSPLLSGSGVLHIKGTRELRTLQGEVTDRYSLEFWYDRSNGNARYHIRNVFGNEEHEHVLLREGQTYLMYQPSSRSAHTESGSSVAMPNPVEVMFRLESELAGWDNLVPVREETIGGRRAVGLGRKGSTQALLYIDKETRLPLRRDGMDWVREGKYYKGASLFEYLTIETLNRESLPPDLFSIRAITAPTPSSEAPAAATPLPEAQISPLLSGPGVLHIEGTEVWRTKQGKEMDSYSVGFYFDRANGDAVYVNKGEFGNKHETLIRNGRTYTSYYPITRRIRSETVSTDKPVVSIPQPLQRMFDLKMRLDEGKLEVIREETFRGKRALVVAEKGRLVGYVDKYSGLTLKRSAEWVRGGQRYEGEVVYEYSAIEAIDPAALPKDLFSTRWINVAPSPTGSPSTRPVPNPTIAPAP